MEFFGQVNYLKGGLLYADYLTTVSRKYAQEIQTQEYGSWPGWRGAQQRRRPSDQGILNGVDYSAWDPEHDMLIAARYSARSLAGKEACKRDLLAEFQLPEENLHRPLLGIVSRFADQKGFDLLAEVAGALLEEDVALVALGAGEAKHERMFRELARALPEETGRENRLRQYAGAQGRGGSGHVSDALAL